MSPHRAAGRHTGHLGRHPTTTPPGAAISPAVTVRIVDQFNNLTASTANVSVAANGPGAFTGTSTTTVAAVGGVATFSNLHLNTAGSYTLGATSTGLTAATSSSFIITATSATHFAVAAAPSTVTAGTALSLTVSALDQFNNVDTTYGGTVHFTSSDPAASLAANSPLPGGTGSFNATLNTSGSRTITATDTVTGSLTGTSPAIAVRGLLVNSFTTTPTGFSIAFSKPF